MLRQVLSSCKWLCMEALQEVLFRNEKLIGGGLASDDLYLLDLRKKDETGIWLVVKVVGPTPGKRYGHTMSYSKPYLIVFGGYSGTEPQNDTWMLSIENPPFSWTKLTTSGDLPPARLYHTAAVCGVGSAAGMVVVFGGRGTDQSALNDLWGLRKHRDGRWDWVKAPSKGSIVPTGRYQVACIGSIISTLLFSSRLSCWLSEAGTTTSERPSIPSLTIPTPSNGPLSQPVPASVTSSGPTT
jgi:hypothetical protein